MASGFFPLVAYGFRFVLLQLFLVVAKFSLNMLWDCSLVPK
jgi:hypothetical protein